MASTIININHGRKIDAGCATAPKANKALATQLSNLLRAPGQFDVSTLEVFPNAADSKRAFAVWRVASGSGTESAVINGVSVDVTWATSDTNCGTLLAAAVNASSDALVKRVVSATSYRGNIACASVVAGNAISVFGYKFVCVASTAQALRSGQFVVGASNALTAASLAAAINATPKLNRRVFANVETANIRIYVQGGAPAAGEKIVTSASTYTVTAPALSADVCIYAQQPGRMGNCVSIAASGTNASIVGSLARLTGGVGGDVALLASSF